VGRSRKRVKISEFDMAKSAYQVDHTATPKLAVKTDGNLQNQNFLSGSFSIYRKSPLIEEMSPLWHSRTSGPWDGNREG